MYPKEEKLNEKRSLLKSILEKGKGAKAAGAAGTNRNETKRKTRKIQIGWPHYDAKKAAFVSVRANKGGGSRDVELPITADKRLVVDTAKKLLFSDGMSTFGPEKHMTFGLANFQHEDVSALKVSGVTLPCTLYRYIDKTKMARVRLYLTSRLDQTEDALIADVNGLECGGGSAEPTRSPKFLDNNSQPSISSEKKYM